MGVNELEGYAPSCHAPRPAASTAPPGIASQPARRSRRPRSQVLAPLAPVQCGTGMVVVGVEVVSAKRVIALVGSEAVFPSRASPPPLKHSLLTTTPLARDMMPPAPAQRPPGASSLPSQDPPVRAPRAARMEMWRPQEECRLAVRRGDPECAERGRGARRGGRSEGAASDTRGSN